MAAVASYWYHNRSDLCVQKKLVRHFYQVYKITCTSFMFDDVMMKHIHSHMCVIMNILLTCTRDQAVLATEGKVADHVQEDTSTHLDGEIKEEGANDVETVGEGPSNSEHQDSVDEGPSDGVDEGPSDGVDEGPSDGVDEGP